MEQRAWILEDVKLQAQRALLWLSPEGCLHRLSLFGYATRFVYRPSVALYFDDTRLTNPDTSGATTTAYRKPNVRIKPFSQAFTRSESKFSSIDEHLLPAYRPDMFYDPLADLFARRQ